MITTAGTLYHMARADFLERVRRRSFLLVLAAAVWLGYAVSVGIVEVRLDRWRGAYNSAWAGAAMAIVCTTLVTLVAFYIVRRAVDRDRQTGVGEILATTPMTKVAYTVGKSLSNFLVVSSIVAVLTVAAFVLQIVAGESTSIEPMAILAPMVLVALPAMAIVAAVAVLFEMIPGLRGGFGNIVYFFGWIFLVLASLTSGSLSPFDVTVLTDDMQTELRAIAPEYGDGLIIGGSPDREPAITFEWQGVEWTAGSVAARLAWFLVAFGIAVVASVPFERFDPARRRLWKPWKLPKLRWQRGGETEGAVDAIARPVHLEPLGASARGSNFAGLVNAELRLLLKGRRWWWYAVAIGVVIAGLANSAENGRAAVLPVAWIWPALVWSSLGAREARFNVAGIVFSTPRPFSRQIFAAWSAGALLALAIASGVVVRCAWAGDSEGLIAIVAGAMFVPALALAAGVWSGGTTLFEALYVALWYVGPLNRATPLDYMGSTEAAFTSGMPVVYAGLAAVLLVTAMIGRRRQLAG